MQHFWEGFVKTAEKKANPEGHIVRRVLLGNPISAAVEAKKGSKTQAFGHALAHRMKNQIGGAAIGGGAGALTGLLASAVSRGKIRPHDALAVGGLGGAGVGGIAGRLKGDLGEEASKIHGKYSKHK